MAVGDYAPGTPRRELCSRSVPPTVVCDMGSVERPDLGTVEALARLRVGMRAKGWDMVLRYASPRLVELLELCGLDEMLPRCEPSALIDEGQPEKREQPLGVEEEVEPGDPAV